MKASVFKFGGASVRDADGIRNAARIIRDFGNSSNLLVVVSAMGKTTNALEELLDLAIGNSEYSSRLEALQEYHFSVAEKLFPDLSDFEEVGSGLQDRFYSLSERLIQARETNRDFAYDQVVCIGEYLSSFLLFSHLQNIGLPMFLLDAANIVQTNETWREGEVQIEKSTAAALQFVSPLLQSGIVVTQGFIGGTESGKKTTLGREGSDYTAALFAYFLDAESVTIWKDVPGVLNADPKWMENTVLLPRLSYQDAAELTYYGATVIHPKTIRPLAWKKIPLYVRSFINPGEPGTIVGPEGEKWNQPAFIRKTNQVLVSLSSRDFSFLEEENITEVLHAFSETGLKMQMLQVSATSISIVTDAEQQKLERAFESLNPRYSLLFNKDLTLVTIQNPSQASEDFILGEKPAILVQRTRSTSQLLFR